MSFVRNISTLRKAKFSGREFSSYSVPKILVFVFVFIFNAQAGTDTPALTMGPKEPVGLVSPRGGAQAPAGDTWGGA